MYGGLKTPGYTMFWRGGTLCPPHLLGSRLPPCPTC